MKSNKKQKIYRKKRTHRKRNSKKRVKFGGEIIGQGGYGCVFYPALNCTNDKTDYSNNPKFVSKLLNTKMAESEDAILYKVENIINDINKKQPSLNILNHFLVKGFKLCIPDKLYGKNKKDINDCRSLTIQNKFYIKEKIKSNNINNNLNQLRLIQLPRGYLNIQQIIIGGIYSFNVINNALIKLLKNGILPINKYGLYNFDVKDSNILFNGHNAQLIDWGVSAVVKNKNKIPEIIMSRGLNHNIPFSLILLRPLLFEGLEFQKKEEIPGLIKNYYLSFYSSQIKNLDNIFKENTKNPAITGDILNIMVDYCSKIVSDPKFNKKEGNFFIFDREKYFREVFLKNVDIYGFIISYYYFLKTDLLDKKQKDNLKKIILKYCLSTTYANIPIPPNNLINDLQNVTM